MKEKKADAGFKSYPGLLDSRKALRGRERRRKRGRGQGQGLSRGQQVLMFVVMTALLVAIELLCFDLGYRTGYKDAWELLSPQEHCEQLCQKILPNGEWTLMSRRCVCRPASRSKGDLI